MASVKLTINGQLITGQSGQSVLQAASAAGIDIPVLCNHPALTPQGSCRMCLVEVEKQRSLQPACTFPISDGMVVQTESEKVIEARKFVLELLFSERQHYCMFCQMSGDGESSDCELQRQAYRYGLTSWEFAPNYGKKWPVDASRKYFIMDHSRCILCRRCIRACDELVANHTLGLRERGSKTMIIADDDTPFGASSCVSCGSCLEVCPTGALIDRRSAYQGHATDVVKTQTTCLQCSVGCGIEGSVRHDTLLRVAGDWNASNGGLLCVTGRFESVEAGPARITIPLVKTNGALRPATRDEALSAAAAGLKGRKVAGAISPRATCEDAAAFRHFVTDVTGGQATSLYGALPASIGKQGTLADLESADVIVVAGGNPLQNQKVLGYAIKRAADRGARLIVVNDAETELDARAKVRLSFAQVGLLAEKLTGFEHPVVVCAAGLNQEVYAALPVSAAFIPLYEGPNAVGVAAAGLTVGPAGESEAMIIFAEDDLVGEGSLPAPALGKRDQFLVVVAAYHSAWTDQADVVLPAQVWTEKQGHVVNLEGRKLPVVPMTTSPESCQPDWRTLVSLSERLGRPMPYAQFEDIPVAR
jgi:formate dehydrogenase major subunit